MSGSQEYILRFQAHICVHRPVTTNSTILVVVGDEKRSQLGTVAGWPPCCLASPCNPPPSVCHTLPESPSSPGLHTPSNMHDPHVRASGPHFPTIPRPECVQLHTCCTRASHQSPEGPLALSLRPLVTPLSSPPHLASSAPLFHSPNPDSQPLFLFASQKGHVLRGDHLSVANKPASPINSVSKTLIPL